MQAAYSSVQVRRLENIHMSSGHANQTELVYYMTFVDENNSFEEGSFTFFLRQNSSCDVPQLSLLQTQRNRCFFRLLTSLSHRLPLSERVCQQVVRPSCRFAFLKHSASCQWRLCLAINRVRGSLRLESQFSPLKKPNLMPTQDANAPLFAKKNRMGKNCW